MFVSGAELILSFGVQMGNLVRAAAICVLLFACTAVQGARRQPDTFKVLTVALRKPVMGRRVLPARSVLKPPLKHSIMLAALHSLASLLGVIGRSLQPPESATSCLPPRCPHRTVPTLRRWRILTWGPLCNLSKVS